MRILIVDDHPMVLAGLAAALTEQQHQIVTARDIASAMVVLNRSPKPELLLLDYHLAEGTVIALLGCIEGPIKPVSVILSGMTDPEDILAVLEQGADAFIPKSIEPDDLGPALETLFTQTPSQGDGSWIWDTQQRCWTESRVAFPPSTVLTPKEREVFMLLRRGLLDKQIAEELGLSIHTVRVHIRSIKRKRSNRRRAEQFL